MTLRPLHRGYRPERRPHPAADCPREEALCRRKLGLGIDQHGRRYGLHDHRPVAIAVSVGGLSRYQSGGEEAHPARSARQHPEFSSISRMASCTTFTPSICCSPKRAPFISWIAATSISRAFTVMWLLLKPLRWLNYAARGGECPERQRELTVNQPPHGFVGSSPTSPTNRGSEVSGQCFQGRTAHQSRLLAFDGRSPMRV